MAIAYFLNQFPLNSTTFIRREIRALEAMGVEVRRFAARRPPHPLVDPQDVEDGAKTEYILELPKLELLLSILLAAIGSPGRFFRALLLTRKLSKRSTRGFVAHVAYFVEACALLRRCMKHELTHVHAHFSTNAAAIACLCRELGGPPFSFTVHGPHEFDAPESLGLDLKAERAKFVVAISQYTRSQLCRWIPHRWWNKLQVVHCGLSERFLTHPQTSVPDTTRLLSVGRLSEQKGQLVLLEAAKRLRDKGASFQIDIVGGGELESMIREEIKLQKLEEYVHLLGWRNESEIIQLLLESRAMVLPSFAEGLPVVLMEALALGRPVISTYIAGIPELVGSGSAGWLVPAGDAEALVEAVEKCLATNTHELSAMAARGNTIVREKHDARIEAAKLRELMMQ